MMPMIFEANASERYRSDAEARISMVLGTVRKRNFDELKTALAKLVMDKPTIVDMNVHGPNLTPLFRMSDDSLDWEKLDSLIDIGIPDWKKPFEEREAMSPEEINELRRRQLEVFNREFASGKYTK